MKLSFGDKIVTLLQERHMTQRELAQIIGANEASLSRYIGESRVPKPEIIANIATALHTTTDYLLGTENDSDQKESFPQLKRILARNADLLTPQQKKELVNALFGE